MIDKQDLLNHVSMELNTAKEDLMWSDKCINPTEGFTHDEVRKTARPNKLGYWVMRQGMIQTSKPRLQYL